ncbi:hypothetical protein lbkm_4052 [Lachnospiraceae bacterium KM106-2]|nr:hypothetical protein lbkm_4052 [Lachnospiraceae bacterium KM106-2]
MKKHIAILLAAIIIFSSNCSCLTVSANTKTDQTELYEESIIRLIFPIMLDVVSQVHGKETMLDYASMNVTNIKTDENNNLILKIKLLPFTGAHNTLSTDYVTVRISTFEVQIINYESSAKKNK